MEYNIDELLMQMIQRNASDLHLTTGIPPVMRINGNLVKVGETSLKPEDIANFVDYLLSEKEKNELYKFKEYDLCLSRPAVGRFRLNIFMQRGSWAIAIRHVHTEIPDIKTLGLPEIIREIVKKTRGLFLVTGPTGSGKSTTLAAMISLINKERCCHIITLEDPIEYLHKHNKSIVNQREIGSDSRSYIRALRAALREDPDVILIGEMRDLETISIALTAAETGHLVLSTLHTVGAPKTIDRIIDVFPPYQQQQVRLQVASILIGVMSQVLIPRIDMSGRVLAYEIMIANPAIRNLIRESKTHQIYSIMQMSQREGMVTLDNNLIELYRYGIISRENALIYSVDSEYVTKMLVNR